MYELGEHLAEARQHGEALEWFAGAAGLGHEGAAARLVGGEHQSSGQLRGSSSAPGPRVFVMGRDVFSNALIVLPALDARRDVAFNRAMEGDLTMGQIRAVPGLLDQMDTWLREHGEEPDPWQELMGVGRDAPAGVCPRLDEASWMWLDAGYLIVAAPRCEELAPAEILAEFGRQDGFDTELADDHSWVERWLDPADSDAIRDRMRELGYVVVVDQDLIDGYA